MTDPTSGAAPSASADDLEAQLETAAFPLIRSALTGVARHFLTLGGGVLVERGIATDSDALQITGAGIAIVGVLLSIGQKWLTAKLFAAAPAAK